MYIESFTCTVWETNGGGFGHLEAADIDILYEIEALAV